MSTWKDCSEVLVIYLIIIYSGLYMFFSFLKGVGLGFAIMRKAQPRLSSPLSLAHSCLWQSLWNEHEDC